MEEGVKLKCPNCGCDRFVRRMTDIVEVYWDEETDSLTDDLVHSECDDDTDFECADCGRKGLDDAMEKAMDEEKRKNKMA